MRPQIVSHDCGDYGEGGRSVEFPQILKNCPSEIEPIFFPETELPETEVPEIEPAPTLPAPTPPRYWITEKSLPIHRGDAYAP